MPTAVIDGISTRYEIVGSEPPLLMYASGGFNAVVEAWSTLGIYQKLKLLDHLPAHFTCILFDRRECVAEHIAFVREAGLDAVVALVRAEGSRSAPIRAAAHGRR
jgi:hypothetical protein